MMAAFRADVKVIEYIFLEYCLSTDGTFRPYAVWNRSFVGGLLRFLGTIF